MIEFLEFTEEIELRNEDEIHWWKAIVGSLSPEDEYPCQMEVKLNKVRLWSQEIGDLQATGELLVEFIRAFRNGEKLGFTYAHTANKYTHRKFYGGAVICTKDGVTITCSLNELEK